MRCASAPRRCQGSIDSSTSPANRSNSRCGATSSRVALRLVELSARGEHQNHRRSPAVGGLRTSASADQGRSCSCSSDRVSSGVKPQGAGLDDGHLLARQAVWRTAAGGGSRLMAISREPSGISPMRSRQYPHVAQAARSSSWMLSSTSTHGASSTSARRRKQRRMKCRDVAQVVGARQRHANPLARREQGRDLPRESARRWPDRHRRRRVAATTTAVRAFPGRWPPASTCRTRPARRSTVPVPMRCRRCRGTGARARWHGPGAAGAICQASASNGGGERASRRS